MIPTAPDSVGNNNVSRSPLTQKLSIAMIFLVILAFGLTAGIYYLYSTGVDFFYSSKSSVNDNTNNNMVTPSPDDDRLLFDDKETQELYRRLASKESVTFDSLPGGVELNGEIFQKIIPRLSEIMRKSGWYLLIEIHTDISGSNEENLKTANERGNRLRQKLIESNVRDEQIKIDGLGKRKPLFPNQNDSSEAFKNRRIVISRIN